MVKVVTQRIDIKAALAVGIFLACLTGPLQAEKYTPPGYGPGQNVEGTGYGLEAGYMQIAEDYYITLNPTLEFGLFDFRIGMQIPLQILALDQAPKGDQKVPSLREGTYNDMEDYSKLFRYIRHGTHLYFNPDDAFNWSLFYGAMNDGYIGHKTIIYRYVTTYDPSIYRAGFMADINNSWGGIEAFQSDVWRKEVVGGRAYIRPLGIAYGIHDLMTNAHSGRRSSSRQLALSLDDARNPTANGGLFYQEGKGSIGQQTHGKIRDVEFKGDDNVRFVERKNPVTGETEVRAERVPASGESGSGSETGTAGKGDVGKGDAGTKGVERGTVGDATGKADGSRKDPGRVAPTPGEDTKGEKWGKTFWSRWAVGYTVVRDLSAPLTLEKDGSNNLVIDPDTERPRNETDEVLTFVGMDTEFRLSPVRWLELTPYADLNRIKNLDNSEGTHIGLDSGFSFLKGFLKVSLRPEYREFSSNYIPSYFDSYYSIERTVYLPDGTGSNDGTVTDESQPKLQHLRNLSSDGAKTKGYFVEFILNIHDWVVLEATYEDYDGLDNSRMFVGLYVPNIAGFFLNGYYSKKGFNDANESFEFDNRSLAAGEIGYVLLGAFYVKVSYERSWQFDSGENGYVANDEKTVSFGFSSDM